MSATLVQRLRESVTQCRALDRSALLEEAAAEIERLRGLPVTEPMPKEKRPEVSVVLTDAEREAVEAAIDRFRDWVNGTDDEEREVALRGLLERLK